MCLASHCNDCTNRCSVYSSGIYRRMHQSLLRCVGERPVLAVCGLSELSFTAIWMSAFHPEADIQLELVQRSANDPYLPVTKTETSVAKWELNLCSDADNANCSAVTVVKYRFGRRPMNRCRLIQEMIRLQNRHLQNSG